MNRTTRKELLDTIDKQQDQLTRCEGRLRDVVKAYKGLLKEKEALEAGVNALTSKEPERINNQERDENDLNNDSTNNKESSEEQRSTKTKDEVQQLQQQIITLTNSLATVTAQKSKMEASFQADKKSLREDNESKTATIVEITEELNKTRVELTEQLDDAKARLRCQQNEREQEHIDHAVMLRELQTLLAQERTEKERLEHMVEVLEDETARQRNTPNRTNEYEKTVKRLSDELGVVRAKLRETELGASKPSPMLLHLQREMAEMKAQHRMQVELEQQKSKEAQEQVKRTASMEEQRVAGLEAKLSELSDVVGNYSRVRQQDQLAIQRLKERITQLDLENTALARAANKSEKMGDDLDETASVTEILERITKYKGLMKLAYQREEKPVDVDEICNIDDYSSLDSQNQHHACQQELKQLKDEFERYKMRAQSVLKSKNTRDTTSNMEIDGLQTQLSDMKDRIVVLRQQLDDQEDEHKNKILKMEAAMKKIKDGHKSEMSQAQYDFKQRSAEMEQQIHKQRDRTLALLSDKDKEIENLKQQLHPHNIPPFQSDASPSSRSSSVFTDNDDEHDDPHAVQAEATVTQLHNRQSAALMKGVGTASLLHYAEEQSRKEVELTIIKRKKLELETALRQLQEKHAASQETHQNEVEKLKEEVQKWKRNRSREGTNLEYLKNVVLGYIQTDDFSSKQSLLHVIATILHFSPKEVDNVTKKLAAGWWG
ncbi:GRIP and coiled-coil domain-containing protein 1-like [Antedon mediterranea]|uniref:GRIP and coiled-coil domain-containing protein 1-like n=1 Tax=Antedon mediterranea TaxID=105859 RepID=UPI003AF46AFC